MTDQKLTDEIEKALRDEAYDGGFGMMSSEQFTDYVRGLAVTAAEVVAEAHTPTDDERGTLTINYCPEHGDLLNRPGDGADTRSYRCREAHHIDEIHAGFRRSEPESSAGATCKHGTSLADLCEHVERLVNAEPQAEPSDAQVEAAAAAIHSIAEGGASWADARMSDKDQHRVEARAALRAAGGVR